MLYDWSPKATLCDDMSKGEKIVIGENKYLLCVVVAKYLHQWKFLTNFEVETTSNGCICTSQNGVKTDD